MNRENIEEILKSIGSEDVPAEVHKIAQETSRDFSKPLMRPAINMQNVRRIIMNSKLTKLAAAAVIIIAVMVGINHFGGSIDMSTVALADVLERVEQAQAFMYKMQMTVTGSMMQGRSAGKQDINGTITISNSYGMKVQMQITTTDANTGQRDVTQQMYILPEKKLMLMIMPEQKKYTRMEFDDDLLARMKKQHNDPREMIKQIMNCQYTELGRSVIDGVEVEGFQTTDPSFMAGMAKDIKIRLWVDVESWLPVRQELDIKMNEQMQMQGVVYDYQWDVQVDASEFEPVIPEDFTASPADGVKAPSISEEAAIEGLKFFVEMKGQYPKQLNLMTLTPEFAAKKDSENLTEAALKLKEEWGPITEDEKMKKIREMMRPVQSLGMFYMMLVQDRKDPAYYGDKVTADDVDKVLMRWKISDDEYRVIFADLTAENVSVERLAELESRLTQ